MEKYKFCHIFVDSIEKIGEQISSHLMHKSDLNLLFRASATRGFGCQEKGRGQKGGPSGGAEALLGVESEMCG